MESLSNSIEKAKHSELELTKEYLVLAEHATINASFELAYDYSQKALIHAQNIEDDLLIAESYALLGTGNPKAEGTSVQHCELEFHILALLSGYFSDDSQ